jgi:hypothetical protein
VVKKAFALRIDAQMLQALQQWADTEFRSVNGQIEYILHDALRRSGRLPSASQPELAVQAESNGSDQSVSCSSALDVSALDLNVPDPSAVDPSAVDP